MRILGLYGSPRKRGNTERIHDMLLTDLGERGAEIMRLRVHDTDVAPCLEYTSCEKKGRCPIEDDMERVVIPALRKADLITVSTPVFFYGVPAGLKALIDRTQITWARKNRLKLSDPAAAWRRGFLISAGATTGEHLFTGVRLTVEYFFDAISAAYDGDLVYRSVEERGDIEGIDSLEADIRAAGEDLFRAPGRRILVASPRSGASALAAAAVLREASGGKDDLFSLGPEIGTAERRDIDTASREEGFDLLSETLDYRIDPEAGGESGGVSGGEGWTPRSFDYTVTPGTGEDDRTGIGNLLEESGISPGRLIRWEALRDDDQRIPGLLPRLRERAGSFLASLS